MALDLRLLASFVAIAEEGNITRAAERLHRSQQSISAHLAQLEQRLDVVLVERSSRPLLLTDRGHVLLVHARALLVAAQAAEQAVTKAVSFKRQLRVAMAPDTHCSRRRR